LECNDFEVTLLICHCTQESTDKKIYPPHPKLHNSCFCACSDPLCLQCPSTMCLQRPYVLAAPRAVSSFLFYLNSMCVCNCSAALLNIHVPILALRSNTCKATEGNFK
jgi:hypothetical protein